MPAAAASRSYAGRSADCSGENAKRARGTRSSTSRHSARQRRDSFIGVTNAPITNASAGMPERLRGRTGPSAGATRRYG